MCEEMIISFVMGLLMARAAEIVGSNEEDEFATVISIYSDLEVIHRKVK